MVSKAKKSVKSMSAEDVLSSIQENNIEFLDLQFTDLPGKLQHVTVPTSQVETDSFNEGVPKLDGSSIRGFAGIHESDMILKPDPSTFAIIPWVSDDIKTARILCDVYWGFGQGRLSRDPRSVSQRAEEHLINCGYDISYWGPEIEFFVFDRVTWDTMQPYQGQGYKVESREAAWNGGGSGYPIRFKEGYFPASPQDTFMEFRNECSKTLEKDFGTSIDAHHHEVATAGQCEIDMEFGPLTKMGDNSMTYKYVVKNLAYNKGMVATMMPKPIFGDNASGMHVNASIWKNGKNQFYDPDDEHAELSQLGRYFGGGLMEHARSLVAIAAPITNSYRRLVPGYEAPVYIAWSRRNRSACVRVPVYQKGEKAGNKKRIEFRPPDPAANPYLCFSAILAAGLDGIKKSIDIGDPVDENIYKLTPKRRRELGIGELPGSLKEAMDALSSDNEYLKPIFTNDIIEKMIEMGNNSYDEVAIRPHPHEFQLYFDI